MKWTTDWRNNRKLLLKAKSWPREGVTDAELDSLAKQHALAAIAFEIGERVFREICRNVGLSERNVWCWDYALTRARRSKAA